MKRTKKSLEKESSLEENLFEEIVKKKITKIKRQAHYHNLKERESEFLSTLVGKKRTDEEQSIEEAKNYYYNRVTNYHNGLQTTFRLKESTRSIILWKKIYARVLESRVGYKQYIDAQFFYFHKNFSKCPELKDLLTENAVRRAREYNTEENKNYSIGKEKVEQGNLVEKVATFNRQIAKMCAQHKLNRTEFYQVFVATGQVTFPKWFLDLDPVYKKAISGK